MQHHQFQSRAVNGQDQRPAGADEWRAASGRALHPAPIIDAPCAPHPDAAPVAGRLPRALRGFTLIEMLCAVAVAGVLSSVALPSFEGQVQRARRADLLVSMMPMQAAQERYRSNGMNYGSLATIGVAARSASGNCDLQAPSFDTDGYEVLAVAHGAQARDTGCSHMSLTVIGANLVYASGPDATVANPADVNSRCWSL